MKTRCVTSGSFQKEYVWLTMENADLETASWKPYARTRKVRNSTVLKDPWHSFKWHSAAKQPWLIMIVPFWIFVKLSDFCVVRGAHKSLVLIWLGISLGAFCSVLSSERSLTGPGHVLSLLALSLPKWDTNGLVLSKIPFLHNLYWNRAVTKASNTTGIHKINPAPSVSSLLSFQCAVSLQ